MSETLKRIISGIIYLAIMWFGTSNSQISYNILYIIIGIASLIEMYKALTKKHLIPFLYVITPFILIHFINTKNLNGEFEPTLVLLMLILTWTFDTFAYLLGVKYGRHKILPHISPKKSWEGFAGGYIFTVIVSYICYKYLENTNYYDIGFINYYDILIITLLLPFTATAGDFIASYYKRKANIKDYGRILPGHGGILDRMDAFTITIPLLFILNILK